MHTGLHIFFITIYSPENHSSLKENISRMASVSSQSSSKYRIRSISLPSRTHPTTQRVEEELNKLKSWESASALSSISAGEICYGLSGLQELYECIDDLLNLPTTMEALFSKLQKEWVDELLDKSFRIIDICGVAKDMVSQCKENVRDLQSSLRRRKGPDCMIVTSITKYFSCSRKLKKEAKRSLANLKQIDQEINASAPLMVDLDDHVTSVIRVLQEVNSTSISVFQTVLRFLSKQSYKQKVYKWGLVAKLVKKERVGAEDQQIQSLNEMGDAVVALRSVCKNEQIEKGTLCIVQSRLRTLEGSLEGLENQLEAMYRCLIRSRTRLLDVFSC